MRNKFLLKNKHLKIMATFVLLLFIAVYACREEFMDTTDLIDSILAENSPAIEKAMSWYVQISEHTQPVFRIKR
jgi:hypothetical protein